jgi:hypothetical protein
VVSSFALRPVHNSIHAFEEKTSLKNGVLFIYAKGGIIVSSSERLYPPRKGTTL